MSLRGQVHAARASQVGIEVVAPERRATGRLGNLAPAARKAAGETDDVVEAVGKIFSGNFHAVVGEFLLDAGGPGLTLLGLESGISRFAGATAKRLAKLWLDDALAISDTVAGVAPKSVAIAESYGGTDAGNDPRTEITVGLGAHRQIQRNARNGE